MPDKIEINFYTERLIKKAFWANFHKSGECFFDYLLNDEENNESTNLEWLSFLNELKHLTKAKKRCCILSNTKIDTK